ncbi:hypothetical protein WISP_100199 [Willisornis vidua]|uniref:Uncharacterized protein n=1 Tax=Willisornis vidua TaxID=1566151 RepID=A0ABQ9CZL7_9PASS|nr:hypothetical protein WISP_100199 [Willisornis vidua]
MCRRSIMNRALLTQLKCEKEGQKEEAVTGSLEKHGDISRVYKDGVAKVEAHLQMKLPKINRMAQYSQEMTID